jgi:hypothetical protein
MTGPSQQLPAELASRSPHRDREHAPSPSFRERMWGRAALIRASPGRMVRWSIRGRRVVRSIGSGSCYWTTTVPDIIVP